MGSARIELVGARGIGAVWVYEGLWSALMESADVRDVGVVWLLLESDVLAGLLVGSHGLFSMEEG